MMKHYKLLIFSIICIISIDVTAQINKRDEIEAMKTAFITRRVNLSPEEARTFWPVYNQYQNELELLRKKRREGNRDVRMDFERISDKDLEKVVDGEIIFRQNELDILKKYHPQFKQVLGVRKVALLYRAEEEFKRELLKRIRENKN